jgi:hypothetical protein
LHEDPGTIPAKKTEQTDEGRAALGAFRERIKAARHAKFWTSPKDLALAVYQSVSSAMKSNPRIGWVRADRVPNESTAEEILGLRKRIDELETHISDTEAAAPAGSEELAHGEEKISIRFKQQRPHGDDIRVVNLSWNQILSILGPILIVQAKEVDLRAQLAEAFRNSLEFSGEKVYYPSVVDEDFQKVKLQLRALGMIQELHDTSPESGDLTLWRLTSYGDRVMTQVAAIRSSAKS